MIYVYVIQSESTNKIYIGYTSNLVERLKRHNKESFNKKSSYTYKNIGPWKLVYKEKFQLKEKAIRREKELKSYQGRKFIKEQVSGP
ncbi:GIY-YIG nuclease family protein [Patescibacteria group bacterium]